MPASFLVHLVSIPWRFSAESSAELVRKVCSRYDDSTKLSDLQGAILPFLERFGVWPSFHSCEYPIYSQSFPRDTTAGVSSRSWTVTLLSKSFMWTFAFSVVLIDPVAVITVVGSRDALTVSSSSGDKSVLLIISMDAPDSTLNSLSSGLTVEVDATAHSNFGFKNVASFSRHVPRILNNFLAALLFLHHLLPKACCLDLCSQTWARRDCDDVSVHPG